MHSAFGELSSWRVCLKSVKNDGDKYFELANGIKAGCSFRNAVEDSKDVYYIRKSHILSSAEDELIDIEDEMLTRAMIRSIEIDQTWSRKDYPKPEIVRREYRSAQNPLLIIYPLDPRGANTWSDRKRTTMLVDRGFSIEDDPIIGFAIVFPMSNDMKNAVIEYAINNSLIDEFIESENYYNQSPDADEYYND